MTAEPRLNLQTRLASESQGPERVGLSWRLGLACGLAITTALGILVSVLYSFQAAQLRSRLHAHGWRVSANFARDVARPLALGDLAPLETRVARLLDHEEIVFAAVRDSAGKRLIARYREVSAPPVLEPGSLRNIEGSGGQVPYLLMTYPLGPWPPPRTAGASLGTVELGFSRVPLHAALSRLRVVTLCGVLAAAVPGLLPLVLILIRIVRPLRDLHRATQHAAEGNLSQRVPLPRMPELVPLANSFNSMLEHVRRTRAEMADSNRNLESIIEERTQELGLSERKYRSFLEQAGTGILIWEPETLEIVEANAKAGELFGQAPGELLERSVDRLFALRERENAMAMLRSISEHGAVRLRDVELEHCERGPFLAEISASLVQLESGTLVFGMLRDLTETRLLERREALLSEKVSRSERMATIGQLAAGVAHEINNPMSYIASNVNRLADFSKTLADITEQSLAPGVAITRLAEINEIAAELQEMAADTCEGVARVSEIVTALREFSHGGRTDVGYEWIDVNRVIRNCLTLIRNEIKGRATVHLELEPLPRIYANATQIGQVLMNLITNSAQAMEEFGVILITSCTGGDRVHLVVEDNGGGILPEDLPKIFDPFFTTKDVGHGTGLGLSVSHEIIRKHGGALWVDSRVDHGTRFLIELMCDGSAEVEASDTNSTEASDTEPEPC